MKMAKDSKRRNFTLVELLVVVVIIAIILGITAPAFSRLMVGNSVDSAARMVSSQLMLARAEAIAKRTYVAVIMPGKNISVPSTNQDVYNRQAFRSAYVEPDSGNTYKFKEWVPGTQWNFLPNGALIATVDTNNSSIVENSGEWIPSSTWTQTDGAGITDVKDGATADEHIFKGQDNSGVRAIVFRSNGRAVERMYITVMEGICMDNDSDIERANAKNIRVMEVNKYTGQTRYIY